MKTCVNLFISMSIHSANSNQHSILSLLPLLCLFRFLPANLLSIFCPPNSTRPYLAFSHCYLLAEDFLSSAMQSALGTQCWGIRKPPRYVLTFLFSPVARFHSSTLHTLPQVWKYRVYRSRISDDQSFLYFRGVCLLFYAHTDSFRVNLFSFPHTLTSSYNFAASYSSIVSGVVFWLSSPLHRSL